jgi:hypothetical protein
VTYQNTRGIAVRGLLMVSLMGSLIVGLVCARASVATAGEADDLQRMIDQERSSTNDLERLDDRRTAQEDVTILRVWLDEAWRQRSEQNYDEVREVLQRCDAQAEMIRQKIVAAKASAQASEKEAAVKVARSKIEKVKQQIQQATIEKARLEARGK